MSEKFGSHWRLMALLNAAAVMWLIYTITTQTEAPGRTLMIMQYVFLVGCLIGLGGAVYKLLSER
ncbi:hypothetical protein MXD81_55725 [Microbacteriaceae bacterium K1510]|nr:hypothetical protein [Microbacteriaceae bacterium K1510]